MHLSFKYRSGWHLPVTGVAVASSILCISTTLNKRDLQYGIFISRINALSNIQGEYYRNINGFSMDIFPKVSKIGSHFFIVSAAADLSVQASSSAQSAFWADQQKLPALPQYHRR